MEKNTSDLLQQVEILQTNNEPFGIICGDNGLAVHATTSRAMYMVFMASVTVGGGTKMMNVLKKICRTRRLKRILVTLPACLSQSAGFYEKMGFTGTNKKGHNERTELHWDTVSETPSAE